MELDHQEAMKLSRELNGNNRRKSVAPPRIMETRSSKKARVDTLITTITPTEPNQLTLPNELSVSLISPPLTQSSPEEVSPTRNETYTPILPVQFDNNSSITFAPPLGIASFVLQEGPVIISSGKPLITTHVGQNFDSTWFNLSLTTAPACDFAQKKNKKKTRSARNVKSISSVEHLAEASDDTISNPPVQLQSRRGQKRKIDDDELSFQEDQSSPEPMEDVADVLEKKPDRKRKSYTKATASGTRKPKLPLYHENVQDGKPDPIGQPEVWAFKRQQLCETLPYYKAYQSGAYTNNGLVHAIMIDKEVSVRDKFDEEIVITSVGGGRLLDEATGKMVYKKDQVYSPIANAFTRALKIDWPVAVIAGQGNKISPSKLPHYYNVLDWFHVTDVWQEKILGYNNIRVSIWKVRLEKIDLNKRSWWGAQTTPLADNTIPPTSEKYACPVCKQESKVRYNIGPSCLNTSCSEFFIFGVEYDDDDLDYHPSFLKERTKYVGKPLDPLSPPPPTNEKLRGENGYGYETLCKRGIVCQKCGCCTRRIEWKQWSCENDKCDYTHRVEQLLVPLSVVIGNKMDVVQGMDTKGELREERLKPPHKNIPFSQSIIGSYDLYNYDLPNESGGISGSVRHFKSNNLINQQRDGPNDLFREVQGSQLDLKRGVAVHKGTTQETLTCHFTQNFGAAYKYLVAQDSKGFGEAPAAVIKASKRMIWAGQHALQESHEPYQPFNECLVLGYFDGNKIGYHDDGEKELGPTVATLSLGANAIMNFRPKKKTHIPSLDEGTVRARGRSGKADADGAVGKGEKPAVLSVKLEHGDIVIMHGREIQKLFEHQVIPTGGLRFALTCRHIDPKTLPNDEERLIAAEKGAFPPGSEQYDYDGSIYATAIIPQQNRGSQIANDIKAKFELGELGLSDMQVIMGALGGFISSQATTP